MGDATYELDQQASAARALIDAYRAEVEDDPELASDLLEGETEFFEALDAVLDLYNRDGELITGIDERSKLLAQRKQRIKARQGRFKAMMGQALTIAQLQKAERPEGTIGITRVAPKLTIEDETQVPTAYFERPDPKVSLKAIKASPEWLAFTAAHKQITAVKRGHQVPQELYDKRQEAEAALLESIPGVEVEVGLDTVSVRSA